MKTIETARLLLRPLQAEDAKGLFALDSNPNVHTFLGKQPVKSMQEVTDAIAFIQKQYEENGIGRWAVIEKDTNEFVGWSGLKLQANVNGRTTYYDLGYRLREEFWGKGFASEAGKAWIGYGFEQMKLREINAFVDFENSASRKVLEKCGLAHTGNFDYEGVAHRWYEIRNPDFLK